MVRSPIRSGVRALMASQAPALWTPDDLPEAYRTNGGFWLAEDQTETSDRVTAWTDRWGARDLTQAAIDERPEAATIAGFPAAYWPDGRNAIGLVPAASWQPDWLMIVAQYRDGTDAAFDDYNSLIAARESSVSRVMGHVGQANLFATNTLTSTARKNGAAASTTVLPLPLSVLTMNISTAVAQPYGIGVHNSGAANNSRCWRGYIFGAVALGTVPTTDERDRIEGWAAHKWGLALAAGHPYESAAPTA